MKKRNGDGFRDQRVSSYHEHQSKLEQGRKEVDFFFFPWKADKLLGRKVFVNDYIPCWPCKAIFTIQGPTQQPAFVRPAARDRKDWSLGPSSGSLSVFYTDLPPISLGQSRAGFLGVHRIFPTDISYFYFFTLYSLLLQESNESLKAKKIHLVLYISRGG